MNREEAIRRATIILARCYSPERIYLIGSSARGDARPRSDLDFVVVLDDQAPALWGTGAQQLLLDIPYPVDIAPFRRRTFELRKDWLMSLPALALREGRLVYAAGTPAN